MYFSYFHRRFAPIVIIIIIIGFAYGGSDENQRCTKIYSKKLFDNCILDYHQMALWCDLTNFTCIPEPEEIQSFAPCERAVYLYMNNSCLGHIDSDILQKYISLESIDFSDNLLTSISNNSFFKASNLQELDVSMNKISTFDPESFPVGNHLRKLSLAQNVISNLAAGTFERLTSLETIILDDNRITVFDVEWFPKRSQLSVVSARNNLLQLGFEPHQGQFDVLKVINLGGNRIQRLFKRNFYDLKQLHEVYLNDNEISAIEDNAFDDASQLTTINLKNNQLESLPKGLFDRLCSLRDLQLSGNHLATLHPDWFSNAMRNFIRTGTPMTSSMTQNNWTCDCRMLGYWKFLQDLQLKGNNLASSMNVECSLPEEFRGSSLKEISKKQLLSSGPCSDNKVADEDPKPTLSKRPKREAENKLLVDDEAKPVPEGGNLVYSQNADECVEFIPSSSAETATDQVDLKNDEPIAVTWIIIIVCLAAAFMVITTAWFCCKRCRREKSKKHQERKKVLMSRDEEVYKV